MSGKSEECACLQLHSLDFGYVILISSDCLLLLSLIKTDELHLDPLSSLAMFDSILNISQILSGSNLYSPKLDLLQSHIRY